MRGPGPPSRRKRPSRRPAAKALRSLHGNAGTPNAQLPDETKEVLDALHALDETGQAFRYTTTKTGRGKYRKLVPARSDQQCIDLPHIAQALRDAGTIVLYGVSGMLDDYREYQQAMRDRGP